MRGRGAGGGEAQGGSAGALLALLGWECKGSNPSCCLGGPSPRVVLQGLESLVLLGAEDGSGSNPSCCLGGPSPRVVLQRL